MKARPARTALVFTSMGVALVAVLGIGTASSPAATRSAPGWVLHGSYLPAIHPTNFVATIDNSYFPLTPGTAFHYEGRSGKTPQTDDMVVTHRTRKVLGVTCTVVRDTVSEHGRPIERTFDWYAQDKRGNVWYMGEDSLELKNGHFVRASDSWEGGVNGGKPGIIMPAHPKAGEVYRQEYYPPGGALDQARVLGHAASITVPDGAFERSLVTLEWSPVEPQLEKKYYVAGIGEVQEHLVQGGHEHFELVRVTHYPASESGSSARPYPPPGVGEICKCAVERIPYVVVRPPAGRVPLLEPATRPKRERRIRDYEGITTRVRTLVPCSEQCAEG